jgi:hypothetical protein
MSQKVMMNGELGSITNRIWSTSYKGVGMVSLEKYGVMATAFRLVNLF